MEALNETLKASDIQSIYSKGSQVLQRSFLSL